MVVTGYFTILVDTVVIVAIDLPRNGDRIGGCHRCQVIVSPDTEHSGLGEAGAARHEKEVRHQA